MKKKMNVAKEIITCLDLGTIQTLEDFERIHGDDRWLGRIFLEKKAHLELKKQLEDDTRQVHQLFKENEELQEYKDHSEKCWGDLSEEIQGERDAMRWAEVEEYIKAKDEEIEKWKTRAKKEKQENWHLRKENEKYAKEFPDFIKLGCLD